MAAGVVADIKDLQVLRSVIRADTVSVVDLLVISESASKHSRHDDTMFEGVLAWADSHADVSV